MPKSQPSREAGSGAPARALAIGYRVPDWPPGAAPNGILTYVAAIAPRMAARGHRVSLVTQMLKGEPGPFPVYETDREAVRCTPGQRALEAVLYRISPAASWRRGARRSLRAAVGRMVDEQRIDLLEIEETFGLASWIRPATRVPMHVRLHGPWFLVGAALGVPEDATFRRRVTEEGRAIASADVVSSPSRVVLQAVRERYGLALPEAEVIPNPTSPIPLDVRWRIERCERQTVLFVGRFETLKGGDLIVDAFARVLRALPGATLLFVGPDRGVRAPTGEKIGVEAFVRARIPGGLERGRVRWLGLLPPEALLPLRRQALVTVVPSRYETFPGTAAEAMACGCPLVAAETGGIPELVEDGVNGLLHTPGDAEDLSRKLLRLMQDPELAARLGQRAAQDAERTLHPDAVVARLEALYQRAIAPRGA